MAGRCGTADFVRGGLLEGVCGEGADAGDFDDPVLVGEAARPATAGLFAGNAAGEPSHTWPNLTVKRCLRHRRYSIHTWEQLASADSGHDDKGGTELQCE